VDDAATGQTWTHAYDARGRRVAQTAPEKDRANTWAGDNRVGEYAAGAQVARFTYGAALDDAIHVDREGTRAHIHADALGTVVTASSTAGVELVTCEYDAFGALRSASGGFENDLAFTGRVRDTTGLLYYRARFYDPALGRFLNPDPIRFEGGINFYAYANNNPTTLTDPTGEVIPIALVAALPYVVGAVVGAATAVGSELIVNPEATGGELLTAGALGATLGVASGGLGSAVTSGLLRNAGINTARGLTGQVARQHGLAIANATTAGGTVAGAGAGAVANIFSQFNDSEPFNPVELGAFTASGAFAGFIGGATAALPFAAAPASSSLVTVGAAVTGDVFGTIASAEVGFGIGSSLGILFSDAAPPSSPIPVPPPITDCVKGGC